MGSSASGAPQKMPANPGAQPVMDMSQPGGTRTMYGGGMPVQMPGGTGPVNNMQQPGGPMRPMMPQTGSGGGWNNIGQPGFATGGPNDPANGGSGWQPPQQNPGMPMPGTQGPSFGRPMPGQPGGGFLKPGQGWADTGGGILGSGNGTTTRIAGGGGGMRTFEFRDSDGNGVEDRDQPGHGDYNRPGNTGNSGNYQKPTPVNPGNKPAPAPKKGAFQGLSKGTMPSMKKHVQAGKMGQARKAFEAGGGKWTKDVHKRLKKKYS